MNAQEAKEIRIARMVAGAARDKRARKSVICPKAVAQIQNKLEKIKVATFTSVNMIKRPEKYYHMVHQTLLEGLGRVDESRINNKEFQVKVREILLSMSSNQQNTRSLGRERRSIRSFTMGGRYGNDKRLSLKPLPQFTSTKINTLDSEFLRSSDKFGRMKDPPVSPIKKKSFKGNQRLMIPGLPAKIELGLGTRNGLMRRKRRDAGMYLKPPSNLQV